MLGIDHSVAGGEWPNIQQVDIGRAAGSRGIVLEGGVGADDISLDSGVECLVVGAVHQFAGGVAILGMWW